MPDPNQAAATRAHPRADEREASRREAPAALRSPRDIRQLDRAAAVALHAARTGIRHCRPGVTTAAVAAAVREAILAAGARPAFEGYQPVGATSPFPAAACISVGSEAVHAPPGERVLAAGDLVTVDVGVELNAWYGDVAESVCIEPHLAGGAERLIRAARRAVAVACRASRPGVWWSSVAHSVRAALAAEGLAALPGYAGHGIGRDLHEQPRAAYDARPGDPADFLLLPGMVFTLEPIVVSPPARVEVGPDGWTVRTADDTPACHVERMVAITRRGSRILGLSGGCTPAASGL